MIVVLLSGGLGNQMFAYAYAKKIASETGEKIAISNYGFIKDTQRKFSLNNFKLIEDVKVLNTFEQMYYYCVRKLRYKLIMKKKPSLHQKHGEECFSELAKRGIYSTNDFYTYYPYKRSKTKVSFLDMGWQSEKYFKDKKEIIINDFMPKTKLNEKTKLLLEEIMNCKATCVHIRRGDYTTSENQKIYGVCTETYYTTSMKLMKKYEPDTVFYIFSNCSDDIEWIKQNYTFPYEVRYVDLNNTDYEDFVLMSKCTHFIISNSSYSWWASYLGEYNSKRILAPSKWILNQDDKDIFCESWETVDV